MVLLLYVVFVTEEVILFQYHHINLGSLLGMVWMLLIIRISFVIYLNCVYARIKFLY